MRNALEERGHFPLLFFLKCLTDSSELDTLLKREIQARDFFLLCDSRNARNSPYVTGEIRFIKSLEHKVYETVDLDADWASQLESIAALSRRATVFLSYVAEDADVAEEIGRLLAESDFRILNLRHDLIEGDDFRVRTRELIDEALAYGFVVVLMTPESVSRKSSIQWYELHTARDLEVQYDASRTRIVPVILRDYQVVMQAIERLGLSEYDCVDLSAGNTRHKTELLRTVLLKLAGGS